MQTNSIGQARHYHYGFTLCTSRNNACRNLH